MAWAEGSSDYQLFLDCACTQHAVLDCRFLCNVRNLPEPVSFQTADGSRLTSTVVGDIYTEDFRLRNVYVIPGLKMNLVSVFQLTQDDISAVFCKNHVELMKGGEQVGGAIVQGKMYLLRYLDAIGDPELHAGPEPTGGSELHASPPVPNESVAWFVATAASSHMKDMECPAFQVGWEKNFKEAPLTY